jgi:hypothetical protein
MAMSHHDEPAKVESDKRTFRQDEERDDPFGGWLPETGGTDAGQVVDESDRDDPGPWVDQTEPTDPGRSINETGSRTSINETARTGVGQRVDETDRTDSARRVGEADRTDMGQRVDETDRTDSARRVDETDRTDSGRRVDETDRTDASQRSARLVWPWESRAAAVAAKVAEVGGGQGFDFHKLDFVLSLSSTGDYSYPLFGPGHWIVRPQIGDLLGGGTVIDVTDTSVTIYFAGGLPTTPIELPWEGTMEVMVQRPGHPDSTAHVGTPLYGGGIIADITDAGITVRYPGGVPSGPVEHPGNGGIEIAHPDPGKPVGTSRTPVPDPPPGDPEQPPSGSPLGLLVMRNSDLFTCVR